MSRVIPDDMPIRHGEKRRSPSRRGEWAFKSVSASLNYDRGTFHFRPRGQFARHYRHYNAAKKLSSRYV